MLAGLEEQEEGEEAIQGLVTAGHHTGSPRARRAKGETMTAVAGDCCTGRRLWRNRGA